MRPPRFSLLFLGLWATLNSTAAQTQVCTFYENQTVANNQPDTLLQVVVSVNSGAVTGSGSTVSVSADRLTYISTQTSFSTPASPSVIIHRSVQMLDASADRPRIQLTTNLTNNDTSSALSDVHFLEDCGPGLRAFWTASFLPGFSAAGVTTSGRNRVNYTAPNNTTPGSSEAVQFEAEAAGEDGTDLAEGTSHYTSLLSFSDSVSGLSFGPFPLSVCLDTTYDYRTSVFYRHGFTALAFFVALLIGFLMVVLAVFIFLMIRRHRKKSSISPSQYDEHRIKARGKKIVMDPKAAMKKGTNIIQDYSIMAWNESIILILSLKDKLHMFREIDNLDVLATILVDSDLQGEEVSAASHTCLLLLDGLRHNGDITASTHTNITASFSAAVKEMDKRLDAEYRAQLQGVYTHLSAKNREKLSELLQKHDQEKLQAAALTKQVPEKERDSLMTLMEQQQTMEENELTFTLALEQNEAAERLRKEFAIRKRMGLKELQQNMLSEAIKQGPLSAEQADWLLKEHKRQQDAVHRLFDDEISRQRMVLEEKLARRRALAQAAETQEDSSKENLNMAAAHIIAFLQKGKKSGVLTANQTEEWIERLKASVLHVKTDMETARQTQETELHTKLSQAKVTQLNSLMKKHEAELQELMKTSKQQQTQGPVDPVSYAESLVTMRSQQRVELAGVENALDQEHAERLSELRSSLHRTADLKMADLQADTLQQLNKEGVSDKAVSALLKKHEAEKESLRAIQQKNKRNQEDSLKEELARRRREWAQRKEKERQEQQELREHEAQVVEKLVSSQVSLSEMERDRIMKEHEKHMVLLENSLTLNKLRQQRALEERLNQKRLQQMSTLQTQQQTEIRKQRKVAENNGEEEEEETQRASLELMKKHAQQRIAVMQGEQLNMDQELEQIRIEMVKERALALKGQEERLGAMITALQMQKAREMTRIEEQQRAINSLKANMMDDLNERGILSTPECERILEVHRQENEALNKKLETQRRNQEKMLREKLRERMQQREQGLLGRQEAEMKAVIQGGGKFAAKVRRVMLKHNHLLQMDQFRSRMEREVTQSLADIAQQFQVSKLRQLQEQELEFVAGLVRVGGFEDSQLMDVLHMLFPGKTQEAVQDILTHITQGREPSQPAEGKSHIVDRVYQSQYSGSSLLNLSGSLKNGGSFRKKKASRPGSSASSSGLNIDPDHALQASRGRQSVSGASNPAYTHDYDHRHSRPLSGTGDYSALTVGYHHDDDTDDFIGLGASMRDEGGEGEGVPTGRLPPLDGEASSRKKRKKKGLLKKHRQRLDQDT